jgi:CHAT domain-containing protein/tetratricopeptide (TPR) repeat protein
LAVATSRFEGRQYYEAEPLLRRLLPQAELAFGPSSDDFVDVLDMLVGASYQTGKGQTDETLLLAERAASTRIEQHGLLHAGTAKSLSSLGVVRAMRGDLAAADSLFLQVLDIREQLDSTKPRDMGVILGHLANIRTMQSDFAGAIPLARRALSAFEEEFGPDSPATFTNRLNLANLLTKVRDYEQARPLLDKQIELLESAGVENGNLATSYAVLAQIQHVIGDRQESLRLLQRALEIREKFHAPSDRRVSESMLNVGVALSGVGRNEEALVMIKRARERFVRYHGSDHFMLGDYDQDLGYVYTELGRYDEARGAMESALRLRRLAQNDESPKVIEILKDLATLSMKEGRYEDARSMFIQAIDTLSEQLGPDHRYVAPYVDKLAQACFLAGRYGEAVDYALRAERVFSRHVRLTMRTLPERQALMYVRQRGRALDLALSLVDQVDAKDLTVRIWDAVITSRAMVLDEMGARNHLPGAGNDPNRIALWEAYQEASANLANLYLRELGDLELEEYQRLLDDANRAMEEAQRSLVGAGGTGAWLEQARGIGWDEVQAALPEGAALLAFVLFQQHSPERTSSGEISLHYRAMVLPARGGEPACIDLGEAGRIDRLIGAWHEEAAFGPLRADRTRQACAAAYDRAASDLREVIWDPVAPLLGDAVEVFIVPDGQIHLVNLAALPEHDGSYLIESDQTFHYFTAERDLVQQDRQAAPDVVLVMGAPDFETSVDPHGGGGVGEDEPPATGGHPRTHFRGERPSCAGLRSMRFEPLPAAMGEARDVAELWASDDFALAPMTTVRLLTGESASEDSFKELAPRCAVLHVATHGYFLSGQCPSGLAGTRGIGLLVPEGEDGSTSGDSVPQAPLNPLLLSGLALSGANHRDVSDTDGEDGILTAQEIAALDLSSVRLAVLSACETGSGEVLNGEGVFGLQRAFRIAGVATLVTSLWSVQDEATREWMNSFYLATQRERRPIIAAVRKASLHVLRARRDRGEDSHPFYWAAFVATGDWR